MSKIGLPSLLKAVVDQGASDLHITVGSPPQLRINGRMIKIKGNPLTPQETKDICYSVLTDMQKSEFEKNFEIDFSFGVKDLSRFRGNIFYQRGVVGGVFRRIPIKVPSFDELGLPPVLRGCLERPNGLILVTGATGSGKTTTLAAMLDVLNNHEYGHIMTIEDPVEYVHQHKNCLVNQREVGVDTKSFSSALRRVLRQDPDYVLVGELRDVETIEMALAAAETGHLVFATLHTNSAIQSINRMINVFPPHQQGQVRQLLSFTLQCIVSQQFVHKPSHGGRLLVCEILIPNPAIRNLIREDKLHQLYSAMQSGQDKSGMQTMNQGLMELVHNGVISVDEAIQHSTMPEEFERMVSRADDPRKGR